MALTPCDPCACTPGNIDNLTFKQWVIRLLCGILEALGGDTSGIVAAQFYFGSLAFGSVGAAYSTLVTNTGNKKSVAVDIFNRTDADILISFNGTDDQEFLAAGVGKIIQFRDNLRYMNQNVSIKRAAGAPTTGTVYGTIIY